MQHGQLAFQKQNERSILKKVRTRHTPSPRIKILKVANSGTPPPPNVQKRCYGLQHSLMLILLPVFSKEIIQMV